MKKLLLIAILMLALVFTVVACTTDEPAVTTDGETTAAPVPETTAEPDDDTTAAPETTEAPETTAAPETTEEVTTEEETTEEVTTADPSLPVNLFDAEALKPAAPMNITSAEIVDGVLHVVPSNADPYWTAFGKVDGARYVAIRYRSDATGADIQFYLASTGDGPVDDSTMLRQPIIADGEWHLIVIDTQPLIDAGKYDGKFVSYFRFDPLEAGYILDENGEPYKPDGQNYARYELPEGSSIDVDYIGFFNSVEYAEDWDYNYVNAPLAMGDAAYLAGQAASGNNMAAGEVTTEYDRTFVRLTTTGGDPYFQILSNANLKANFLAISYRTNSTTDGQIFVGSGGGPSGAGDCPNVAWNEDGNWNLVVIDLAATEGLTSITDGIVNYLRLDFFTGAGAEGDYFDVEYVAFFKSVAAAETYYNDMHAPKAWDSEAGKTIVTHQSFDELRYLAAGEKVGEAFAPGASAGWNKVAILTDGVDTLNYWGWVGVMGDLGEFGYAIDGGEYVFSPDFAVEAEAGVVAAAGGADNASRFLIGVNVADLATGAHTVTTVYKTAAGYIVVLNEFTVYPAAPAHEDSTIVLGERADGGPFGNAKNFGQRFTVADGFLKNITVTTMATYADGNTNKWNVTVWQWNGDYATTVAGTPLYTVNGENHNDNADFSIDIPAALQISGDIYYEVTYVEGSAAFTGWTANGAVVEGIETYAGGELATGTYASSIVVGIPAAAEETPDEPADDTTEETPEA